MRKKYMYKKELENLVDLCKENNIKFSYISYWSGFIMLDREVIFDIYTLEEIQKTKFKVQQFIDRKD